MKNLIERKKLKDITYGETFTEKDGSGRYIKLYALKDISCEYNVVDLFDGYPYLIDGDEEFIVRNDIINRDEKE